MFTNEERLQFADWIRELEWLIKELASLANELNLRSRACEPGHSLGWDTVKDLIERSGAVERAIEHLLGFAPIGLPPRQIIFGGGGMGSIYGPPVSAPSDGDIGTEVELSTEASAGVGDPIYIDPLVYSDWGWTKHDPRPAPKPQPLPSLGTEAQRTS